MQTEARPAHYVRVRYHGETPSNGARYIASWEGWTGPGRNAPRVRRKIEWCSEPERMARTVATAFCAWLSDMPGEENPVIFTPARVTYASVSGDEWAVLIETRDSRESVA